MFISDGSVHWTTPCLIRTSVLSHTEGAFFLPKRPPEFTFLALWRQKPQNKTINYFGDTNVDDLIFSERIQVERKQFYFDLKENPRGRFLRITEDVGGRRDTIIVPATGLEQFVETITRAIQAGQEAPGPMIAAE